VLLYNLFWENTSKVLITLGMKIAFFWDVVTGGLGVGTSIFEESVFSIFRLQECPESGIRPMYQITQNHILRCYKVRSELDFELLFLLGEPLLWATLYATFQTPPTDAHYIVWSDWLVVVLLLICVLYLTFCFEASRMQIL